MWYVYGYFLTNLNLSTSLRTPNCYIQIALQVAIHLSFWPISWLVVSWSIESQTGNRELGFCSGEGVWEITTTSKEGSRRVNYPILISRGSDKKSQYYAWWLYNCIEKNRDIISIS